MGSYESLLSEDSYAAKFFKPKDRKFIEMLKGVKITKTNRPYLIERKIQSHKAKKRHPKDHKQDWTAQMEQEHTDYKAKVDIMSNAKKTAEERNFTDPDDNRAWLDTAIE